MVRLQGPTRTCRLCAADENAAEDSQPAKTQYISAKEMLRQYEREMIVKRREQKAAAAAASSQPSTSAAAVDNSRPESNPAAVLTPVLGRGLTCESDGLIDLDDLPVPQPPPRPPLQSASTSSELAKVVDLMVNVYNTCSEERQYWYMAMHCTVVMFIQWMCVCDRVSSITVCNRIPLFLSRWFSAQALYTFTDLTVLANLNLYYSRYIVSCI